MLSHPPRGVLRALGQYEECLVDVQREYRRLASARGPAREAAQREYERAMERARAMGGELRRAQGAS